MKNYLNTTTYSIAWFKKANESHELQMSPPFQRNPVWTEKQKSYLIDSVLCGYPIPEIYIQEKMTPDGCAEYVIVDGQQRIRSVLEFLDGRFEIAEGESDKWAGFFFDNLSPDEKTSFYSYKFVVRCLPDISDEEIRSIFQRINKNNVKLNSQELRQSTYSGDFIKSMNEISDRLYWKDIGLFSAEKVRRMLDVEYISEIAISVLNGHQNKKDKLEYYYQMYESEYHETERMSELFDKVCFEIIQMLPDIKKTRWNNLVDFYTLFLVLAEQIDDIPFAQDMRIVLREKLISFSLAVSEYQRQDDERSLIEDENVSSYASGIRNSSDLSSRRRRFSSLKLALGFSRGRSE